ncbi:MAG TPA: cytochrome c [Thermoanaerobaculia bacterium]
MRSVRFFVVVLVVLALAVPGAFAADNPAKEKKEGKEIFAKKCQACHGSEGAADTTMAKNMKVRPLSSEEVQKQSKEELIKITSDGKGKMPAFKSKMSKDEIQDVVDYIKSLKKK